MGKGRLEAFSDGVLAIIITIMVLELKVPEEVGMEALMKIGPKLLSYLLSFIYIGIYWNNHHHMLHAAKNVNGKVLWANLHLLFWLSLIPFTSAYMGEHHFEKWGVIMYGIVLLMAAIAYSILAYTLISHHGKGSTLDKAIGRDNKGKISVLIYMIGLAASFFHSWIGLILYVIVALIWFIPDKRIENTLEKNQAG